MLTETLYVNHAEYNSPGGFIMNYEDMKFCQSCAMPMSDEHFASEKDGSKSEDYCKYCYQDGEFTSDVSMEEMIDYSAPKAAEATGISEEEARKMCEEMFPKLKRWMK